MADIPVRRVTPMRILESQSQGIGSARNHDQVNVIGHEAVADQGKLMQSSIVSEKVKIDEPFSIGSQNELSGITTLGNVVRDIDGNHSNRRHFRIGFGYPLHEEFLRGLAAIEKAACTAS